MQASGLTRRRIAHTAHAGREAAARSIKTRATASHLGAPFGPQQLRAAHAAASAALIASYSRATDVPLMQQRVRPLPRTHEPPTCRSCSSECRLDCLVLTSHRPAAHAAASAASAHELLHSRLHRLRSCSSECRRSCSSECRLDCLVLMQQRVRPLPVLTSHRRSSLAVAFDCLALVPARLPRTHEPPTCCSCSSECTDCLVPTSHRRAAHAAAAAAPHHAIAIAATSGAAARSKTDEVDAGLLWATSEHQRQRSGAGVDASRSATATADSKCG